MKDKEFHAVDMTRAIRDKDAVLYWKNKDGFLKQLKDAAKRLETLRSLKKAHGT